MRALRDARVTHHASIAGLSAPRVRACVLLTLPARRDCAAGAAEGPLNTSYTPSSVPTFGSTFTAYGGCCVDPGVTTCSNSATDTSFNPCLSSSSSISNVSTFLPNASPLYAKCTDNVPGETGLGMTVDNGKDNETDVNHFVTLDLTVCGWSSAFVAFALLVLLR